ncbi:polyserase-2 [Drosophila biarmipes]|uniref:polyserase-2 n=1 Tax=Drosophila biarmipes TaxID=125945 RepID=UPI0021CD038B|nr:polyserase-2 [Drosophila biarmipes]
MTTAAACYILFGLLLIQHGSTWLLDEDCGVAVSYASRVMYGVPAELLDNPWMAVLRTPTEFICGGTLINSQFVLTAAHCLCQNADCTAKRDKLTVSLGVYNRSAEKEPMHDHEDFDVVATHLHEGFDKPALLNDIALLKLHKRVVYKAHIRPMCIELDSRSKPTSDAIKEFTIVGWGRTETGHLSDVLRTARVSRKVADHCTALLWSNWTDSMICAGSSNSVDTCNGDSGGPLYAKVLDGGPGRQTQFGIVSTGTYECSGKGVYTDVMSHVDFIQRIALESDISVILPKIHLLDEGCLDDPKSGRRAETPPDTYSWLAQVYMDAFVVSYGALISQRFVLTTAQLVPEDFPLKVLFGETSESLTDAYEVSSVHRHPEFASLAGNDIALLKLERSVDYSDSMRPICLPSPTNRLEQEKFQKKANLSQELTAVGWGIRSSTIVRRAKAAECYQGDYQAIGDKQICMEHPNSLKSNVGSGSPLVKRLAYGNSRAYTLVGLASFGRNEGHSRDVYTNVLSYMDWIGTIIE